MDSKTIKQQLRKEVSLLKKRLSPELLFSQSIAIGEQLEKHPLFLNASCIAFYYALPDEVQTAHLIEKWHPHKTILLPVIDDNSIFFIPYQGKEKLNAGSFGVLEPHKYENKESLPPIDLIIVPGIAFDRKLNRLGRGKGYYDRFLAATTAPKIGICFDLQLFDSIPTEPFDIKMNTIITPDKIIR